MSTFKCKIVIFAINNIIDPNSDPNNVSESQKQQMPNKNEKASNNVKS